MTQGGPTQTQGWSLRSADGLHAIPDEQGRYALLEGERYLLKTAAPRKVLLGPMWVAYDPLQQGHELPIPRFQSGQLPLYVDGHQVPLVVLPHADKADPASWARMLGELEQAMPGGSLGHGGLGQGDVQTQGVAAPFLIEALVPLIPELLRVFVQLCERLRTQDRDSEHGRRLVEIRRPESAHIRALSRNPTAASWVLPDRQSLGPMPVLPVVLSRERLDHPANRAVVWMILRIASRLQAAGMRLRGSGDSEPSPWRSALAESLLVGGQQLKRTLRRSALGSVQPAPPSPAAMLVLGDDPWYARVNVLARRFLSPAFDRSVDAGLAPQRPTYDLYEHWCFVELLAGLKGLPHARKVESWGLDAVHIEHKGRSPGANVSLPGGRLELRFNLSFAGYLERGDSEHFSISHRRRPDFVLRWKPLAGVAKWLALDAKYRVHPETVADSFDSVHRYAHGLRADLGDGALPPEGVLLLTPRQHPDCGPWYQQAYFQAHRCGALALAPGQGRDQVMNWILGTLNIPEHP